MRILLIHNFYQYLGGEDSYVTNLKKLLEDNGQQVYLYSKDSKNIKTVWDKVKAAIGLFYNPLVERELIKIIKEFKPDIAHFHNIYPLIGATAYRVCKKYKVKIAQHIHNYRFMCPKGILFRNGKICELCLRKRFPFWAIIFGCYHTSRLASFFLSLSFWFHRLLGTFEIIDKYIFPSKFALNYFTKYSKISKQKTFFLPHFIDLPKNLKEQKKIKKEDFFLFVGRLSEEKGIIELLEVFKTLPKYKLIVIGDGPLKNTIKKFFAHKNVKIVGVLDREKILKLMRSSLALIIPSLGYEIFPLVFIEAFSLGTFVLVPSMGVFKKDIGEHKTVFFYEYRNREDLRKKIIFLYKKRNYLNKITDTVNQRGFSYYTSETYYKKILKFYQEIKNKYVGEN